MALGIDSENWFWLVVSILAVWRMTCLMCYDSGPFEIMNKLRSIMYRLKLGKLIDCFYCTAFWFSIIHTLVIYEVRLSSVFLILAIAGGSSIIERLLTMGNIINEDTNNG